MQRWGLWKDKPLGKNISPMSMMKKYPEFVDVLL